MQNTDPYPTTTSAALAGEGGVSELLLVAPTVIVLGLTGGIALVASAATSRPLTQRIALCVAVLNCSEALGLILLVAL